MLVAIVRPFAAGKLTGHGWLSVESGALVFQGGWPAPGTKYCVAHTDTDVEVQIRRVTAPWLGAQLILHDENAAVVVVLFRWYNRRTLELMRTHGFTPRVRHVWHSSAVRRARKWLLEGTVEPNW